MARPKPKTVEQYSPFLSHPRPDAVAAPEPEAPSEPVPVPAPKAEPEAPKADAVDMLDMARKLIAGVRARDEEVVAAVLKATRGA